MDTEITSFFPTSLRRILLILITLVVSALMGSALLASWQEPQVASRLELYQTDLLLQATAWEGGNLPAAQTELLRQNLLGDTPLNDAQTAYESVRETVTETLAEISTEASQTSASPRLQTALAEQAELLDLLDLRLGILHAEQGDIDAAVQAWNQVQQRQSPGAQLWQAADALKATWQNTSVSPQLEPLFQEVLQGWFRTRALEAFYTSTQATAQLTQLQQAEVVAAERTIVILGVVGALPAVGALLGALILAALGLQRLFKGSEALLARHRHQRWNTPWNVETIWWVLVGGFFFLGQLVVPVVMGVFRAALVSQGLRGQALYSLIYYVLMASGTIAILLFNVRSYRPLPAGWFRFGFKDNWLVWGIGGYLAALPLMLTISIVNQRIWQGQGGSNPLLQTVLEADDPIALGIFFTTAAIAAPLFEEFLFRGFLLPSLTRYLPVGGAIALSSFIFAAAHLSLSEVLPLMVLGIVLGVVYTRSRSLLAPMLLHSAWNSVTMLGLFLLGSHAT